MGSDTFYRVTAFAWTPNEEYIILGTEKGNLKVADLRGNFLYTKNAHAGEIYALAVSPDGRFVASAGWDDTYRVWRLVDDEPCLSFKPGEEYYSRAAAFSPSGDILVTSWTDWTIRWLDVRNGKVVMESDHEGTIDALVWRATDNVIIAAKSDGTIYHIDGASGHIINTVETGLISVPMLSANGRVLAVDRLNGTVSVWSTENGENLRELACGAPTGVIDVLPGPRLVVWANAISAIALSSDGRYIVTGHEGGYVRLWETATGQLVRQIARAYTTVTRVAFSPSDSQLLIGLDDGRIRIEPTGIDPKLNDGGVRTAQTGLNASA